MTIAQRLIVLLAVPLVALVGLGWFVRQQLKEIEVDSRFVAESRIEALATLGDLSRASAELRIALRDDLLAQDPAHRAAIRAAFDQAVAEQSRLLRQYADGLVVGDRGRRLLNDYQAVARDWMEAARQVMTLTDAGQSDEASAYLAGEVNQHDQRRNRVANE